MRFGMKEVANVSELARLLIIVFLAGYVPRRGDDLAGSLEGFLKPVAIVTAACALLLAQPDMGSALTLAAVAAAMLLVAGTRLKYLASIGLLSLPFLYFMVMNVDYRRRRILAFLNPWEDPSNSGFQIIQSWIAFGSGGAFGQGLGESKQKLFYLPEAHTDFIFSVIGEEFGLVGTLFVLLAFVTLFWRGLRAAFGAPDRFGFYLALGITTLLTLQALVNMGVCAGLLPTKGLTLPLMSYGGNSLIVACLVIGMLLRIDYEIRRDDPVNAEVQWARV